MPPETARFKVFVPMLKAWKDEATGEMILSGVASSSIKDLHGDVMEETALQDMLTAAQNNLTIFLNHSYAVPEDVAASVKAAHLERASDGIVDLHFDKIVVNAVNKRAVEAWASVEAGTKLGLSIGAMIPDGGAKYDKKAGGWSIAHVNLLETSMVGVPANPRSWLDYAIKAMSGHYADAFFNIIKTKGYEGLSGDIANWEADDLDVAGVDPDITLGSTGAHQHPHAHAHDHEHRHGYGSSELVHDHEHGHIHSHEHEDGHEHNDEMNEPYQHDHWHRTEDTDHAHDTSDSVYDSVEVALTKDSHPELPDKAFACIDSKGRHYPHHNADGSINLKLLRNALSRLGDPGNVQCGKAHLERHAKAEGVGDSNKDAGFWTEGEYVHVQLEGTEGLAIPVAGEELWCADEIMHLEDGTIAKAEEILPDLTKATVWVTTRDGDQITIGDPVEDTNSVAPDVAASTETDTTGAGEPDSQGASSGSNPENETPVVTAGAGDDAPLGNDDMDAAMKALGPAITATLKSHRDLTLALISELTAKQKEADDAKAERDAVVTAARTALTKTAEVLEALKKTPSGRRAVFREQAEHLASGLESVGDVISESALAILRSSKKE